MKDYKQTEQYQRTSGDFIGAIHLGFLALAGLGFVGMQSCEQDPKAKAYDTVTIQSRDMTYDIAFVCTREHLRDESCKDINNIESVFINKLDSWSVSYGLHPQGYERRLTSPIRESAWHLVQGENYLRLNAEKEQNLR